MIGIGGKKTYTILGVILILLIFFNYIGWLNPIKKGVRSIFLPIFAKTNDLSVKVGENYEFFKNREEFFESYRQCRADQLNTQIEEASLAILIEENLQLKEILSFQERSKSVSKIARVIGKNIEKTDQTIIIDRGTEEGMLPDQPVVVGNGLLIGKIVKAENGVAIVRLINDNQSKIAATVLNHERSLGVVEGGYGLSIKMNFIPRNETVRIGDQIVTSGLEENIPRGLLIGTVTAIENETFRPFQSAVLVPGADLNKLSIVSVLTNL